MHKPVRLALLATAALIATNIAPAQAGPTSGSLPAEAVISLPEMTVEALAEPQESLDAAAPLGETEAATPLDAAAEPAVAEPAVAAGADLSEMVAALRHSDPGSREIQRDRARNAWEYARSNADKMRITAPMDGLVVLKSIWKQGTMGEVQEGEEVRAGIPILDVVDPTTMRVRAKVNQADAAYLKPGSTVKVTLDSYPVRPFSGKIEYVSPVAITSTMSQRVRTFLAVFSVEGTDEHLLPDLAAAVDVPIGATR